MMAKTPKDREKHHRRALADLAEMTHGTEGVPGTGMANASKAVTERLKAYGIPVDEDEKDSEENARIDRLGKLIGRSLGYLALAYLIYHLVKTYIWP